MNHSIENNRTSISVSTKGAELQSFFDKHTGTEYMWGGNPDFWGKKSPVLFPIVGSLKDNTYFFNHKSYQLGRHGFARDREFTLNEHNENSLLFSIQSDESSLKIYPFEFEFSILYTLKEAELSVTYIVKNTGNDSMFFSVGGHPAFKVPIFDGDEYTDYSLVFNKTETTGRWPITAGGLIDTAPVPLLQDCDTIRLNKELFQKDAIVLKNLNSDEVKLISAKNNRGINFSFAEFAYLGIWSAKNADFVCIEPWCGIADSANTNQSLVNKEGINKLAPACMWERKWCISIIE